MAFKNKLAQDPKGPKDPYDFACPRYDERSGKFINAGWKHGVGVKQPVGSLKHSPESVIPMGRVETMAIDEKA